MENNYTTTATELRDGSVVFNTAQITLNNRVFPSKRKTFALLQELCNKFSHKFNRIIVHYDFVYIASRFSMFAPHVKKAIMEELKDILYLSTKYPQIQGVVMHTDYPIAKEYFLAKDKEEFIRNKYKAGIWDIDAIFTLLKNPETIVSKSIKEFVNELDKFYSFGMCHVFLENTTKTGGFDENTIDKLASLVTDINSDAVGVCYDTEHEFAVTGKLPTKEFIGNLCTITNVMVHLNTIPSEVKAKSNKDRHSFTTIFDCSQLSVDAYEELIHFMDNKWISWVREVKQETMLEEIGWFALHQ